MKYKHITVGGTFDHFHQGHKVLLEVAFGEAQEVWLGISTDGFAQRLVDKFSPRSKKLESFALRKKNVEDFLKTQEWSRRAHIIALDDKYGTTLTDPHLEAIVVSFETKPVAVEINNLRKKQKMEPLVIITIDWVEAADETPIHSLRIRRGDMDEWGNVFSLSEGWGIRKITPALRDALKKPLGKLLSEKTPDHDGVTHQIVDAYKEHFIICVGDAVTESLLSHGLIPHVSVVDLHVQRKKIFSSLSELGFTKEIVTEKVKNAAGTLSHEAFTKLKKLLAAEQFPAVLQVLGEEDLLTLFAILLAPLDAVVLYGQPNEGVVVVEVTIEKKKEIGQILRSFRT